MTIPLWVSRWVCKNWFVKSIVFARDFPCFPCIGRFRSSTSNEATWSTGPLHPILWIASENRVEPVASCTLVPPFLPRREREKEREEEREKQDFHATSNPLIAFHPRRRKRGEERDSENERMWSGWLFDRGYYFGGRLVFRLCVEMFEYERKWGFKGEGLQVNKRQEIILSWKG